MLGEAILIIAIIMMISVPSTALMAKSDSGSSGNDNGSSGNDNGGSSGNDNGGSSGNDNGNNDGSGTGGGSENPKPPSDENPPPETPSTPPDETTNPTTPTQPPGEGSPPTCPEGKTCTTPIPGPPPPCKGKKCPPCGNSLICIIIHRSRGSHTTVVKNVGMSQDCYSVIKMAWTTYTYHGKNAEVDKYINACLGVR
jgi:hypothetical protein